MCSQVPWIIDDEVLLRNGCKFKPTCYVFSRQAEGNIYFKQCHCGALKGEQTRQFHHIMKSHLFD